MNLWLTPKNPTIRLGTYGPPFLGFPFLLKRPWVNTHKHVQGLTGQGKSKLLASVFVQLLNQGVGCSLIDPHSDLATDCLSMLIDNGFFRRPDAFQKLLYIDFSRQDRFLPFNVLKQPYDDHSIARNMVEVCKRAWSALADGAAPQFENITLASTLALVQNDLPLTTLPKLLTNKPYREKLLQNVRDPNVVEFFHTRFDQWGREAPLMIESTLRRIFLLTFSPVLRYTLGQRENVLDFRKLMDTGTSVIFNLGGLDEDTQRFLGCLLTVGYEVAALSRADLPERQRRTHHLILDEFSMFSAQSEEALARVLSLARKYGLFLALAHQTWSQISQHLQGALQNCVHIAFKLGHDDAAWAAPRFGSLAFDPYTVKHQVQDEYAVERTHPVFFSIPEVFQNWTQALETLNPREAYVKLDSKTVKVRTPYVPPPRCSRAQIEEITDRYAQMLMTAIDSTVSRIDQPITPTAQHTIYRRVPINHP